METITSLPLLPIRLVLFLRCMLAFVACCLLSGCFDTKQDITLNPDGSGKMTIESVFIQAPELLKSGSGPSPQEGLTNYIRKTIEQAQGVDAWRDISFHLRNDGKAFFRGTAYFADLSKFKINAMLLHQYAIARDDAGNLTISVGVTPPAGSPIQKPDEPVTAESLQRDRATVQSAMPLIQSTIGSMKQDTTIHVPGVIKRVSNFETNQPRTLHLQFDGTKLVESINHFYLNTNFDQTRIRGELSSLTDLANERIYGQRGPILAVFKPGTAPLFDYAKEVADAQQAFPEFVRQLRAEPASAERPKPAVDGQPAELKVTGIEWFGEESPTRSDFFSSLGRRNYTLHLSAKLSGIVLQVNKVQFNRAKTLEGLDLLPPYHNADLSAAPSIGKDKSTVFFRANLQPPPANSKGIADISGVIECSSMASQRTVDLISGRLRAGTKGTEFDTQIETFDPRLSGSDRISISTQLKPEQLRSIRVLGNAGQLSNLEQRGHTAIGDRHIITYICRNEIPATGKIVAEVLTGEQTLRIPFAMTNVSLLGQPLQ